MNAKLRFLGGLVVPMVLVVACGSSSKSKGGGADSGPSGAGGKAGGSGGSSGKSDSGSGGAAALKCDLTACTGKTIAGIKLDACCISDTVCGNTATIAGMTAPCSALPTGKQDAGPPIVLDPLCKDMTISVGAGQTFAITGCCAPSGQCGGSVAGFGGCITASDIAKFGGPKTDAGPPIECHYPGSKSPHDSGTPEKTDAGHDDAGK